MDPGLFVALAVVCLLLVAGLSTGVVLLLRDRRRLSAQLTAARDDVLAVERRLDALTARLETPASAPGRADREYLITSARPAPGREVAVPGPREPLTAKQFASVAAGESLVTLFSFGYGVRRALSAENRNRIGFEMRREVRRSRKQRRRELKQARRTLRTAQRSDLGEDAA